MLLVVRPVESVETVETPSDSLDDWVVVSRDDPALDSEEDESALRYVVGPIGPALFRCRGGWDDFTPARSFVRSIVPFFSR